MPRSTFYCLLLVVTFWLGTGTIEALGALPVPVQNAIDNLEPPGGAYLSWYKLLTIAIVFLVWVRTTDWANKSSIRIGDEIGMPAEVWNPILVGSFLAGLLAVLFVPYFSAGITVYLIGCLAPWLAYWFMRRARLAQRPDLYKLASSKGKSEGPPPPPPLPQDEGAPMDFSPAGRDKQEKQSNLIRARQSAQFPALKNLLADMLAKRAELMLLDYGQQAVTGRFQVDGVWHPLPVLDRTTGDAILVSIKSLAGLNHEDRKNKQQGDFQIKTASEKLTMEVATAGVPTGERAQIKFVRQRKAPMDLPQLGMFPEMLTQLKSSLKAPGISIISAPKGEGLTATWQGALMNADRLTRDCVALVSADDKDSVVENIVIKEYNSPINQIEMAKTALLTQPDFMACPSVDSDEMMEILIRQANHYQRSILLRGNAHSAAEGLILLYNKTPAEQREEFLRAVQFVTGQKLIRRLCSSCRQEVRVTPDTIQKLGGNPQKQQNIFNEYRLPPPEQRVDEKGRPIEIPPCPVCGGISYLGRIAIFEMLIVNDEIRNLVRQKMNGATIEAAAQKGGKISIQKQAHKLVLLGVTSIAEVQRVFKK